jgi:homopolymeric O-antigen transport system permease protein
MTGKHFRQLVTYNVICNLKTEVNRYALNYFWWIIEPTLHLLILYIVFGVFFGQSSNSHYIPFLFCGLVPWFWFNKSISNGLDSILNGRHIIRDTHIPKYFFPSVSIIQDTIKELFVFIILIATLIANGLYPQMIWLLLPVVMLLEFLLIASLVFFVSIIIPYFLDLKHVITAILQVVMFGSGTFYDYKMIPIIYQELFLLNPIALLINMYRNILINNTFIDVKNCIYVLSFSFCFGVVSFILHKKLDRDVPKVLYR